MSFVNGGSAPDGDERIIVEQSCTACAGQPWCRGVLAQQNVRSVPGIEEHPRPAMLRTGLLVTLNSDDPTMFGTDRTDAYRAADGSSGHRSRPARPQRRARRFPGTAPQSRTARRDRPRRRPARPR
ncbi:hypothetical protein IQ251_00445 [Saccharopolyspora sp. HNM0983]|uniref:Adenosine deaminase domain-containing protein n=1 Tax=Saccharopolyspora montiporae TaxID=2781240 RepID=A0A929FVX1_9PSEU|nr:hypothetical protein [Saccharopolyspora sp. HNM0983]